MRNSVGKALFCLALYIIAMLIIVIFVVENSKFSCRELPDMNTLQSVAAGGVSTDDLRKSCDLNNDGLVNEQDVRILEGKLTLESLKDG